MNKKILIATENRGKAEEIKEIFKDSQYELSFLFDFKDKIDFKIQENAKSFEGNALIKAIVAGDMLDMITLGDDSGLVISALDGRPGINSARYAGTGQDEDNIRKVLEEMKNIPWEKRDCYYNCTVAIYDPETKFIATAASIWEGKVGLKPKGSKSFGYAPIILSKDFNYTKTNAEFDHHELIKINHRGQAFKKAIGILNEKYII
jgi:XTP/dITP diphosphohydrolase